jgi:hypothetical protein
MQMWSSFEALVVRILEVKTDCNFVTRFKSYSFFKKDTCYQLAYFFLLDARFNNCRVVRPPGASVWHAPAWKNSGKKRALMCPWTRTRTRHPDRGCLAASWSRCRVSAAVYNLKATSLHTPNKHSAGT